jgi:hypothetical protein
MTATVITLHDYVAQVRSVIPYVHPAGRATIDEWLSEMRSAADIGDAATVARFARMVADKVELEQQWQRDDGLDVDPPIIITPLKDRESENQQPNTATGRIPATT